MRSLLSLLLLTATLARADELLMSGSFHGDEVRHRSGEEWLALHQTTTGAMLQPVRIAVEREFDPILDENGKQSGKRVEAIGAPDALFLVRSARLHPGPVTHAVPESAELRLGDVRTFALGKSKTSMELHCGTVADPEGFVRCALVLESGGIAQQLATIDAYVDEETHQMLPAGDAVPEVLWAGDLDHDGRLDFVANLSGHYNIWSPALFLSSAARDGELVAKVATFSVTGC